MPLTIEYTRSDGHARVANNGSAFIIQVCAMRGDKRCWLTLPYVCADRAQAAQIALMQDDDGCGDPLVDGR